MTFSPTIIEDPDMPPGCWLLKSGSEELFIGSVFDEGTYRGRKLWRESWVGPPDQFEEFYRSLVASIMGVKP